MAVITGLRIAWHRLWAGWHRGRYEHHGRVSRQELQQARQHKLRADGLRG